MSSLNNLQYLFPLWANCVACIPRPRQSLIAVKITHVKVNAKINLMPVIFSPVRKTSFIILIFKKNQTDSETQYNNKSLFTDLLIYHIYHQPEIESVRAENQVISNQRGNLAAA